MSDHVATQETDGDPVFPQYETIGQQQESYIVGMWTFLVTEIMFFGGLFLVYILYRWKYSEVWAGMSGQLDYVWGGINTMVLLLSSFFMAMAVHCAQKKREPAQIRWLLLTILCAFGFLGIKYKEYTEKINEHHLWPDWAFVAPDVIAAGQEGPARLFMSLYFTMTGLHGVHVVIGILVITALIVMIKQKRPAISDYIPTEMVGLYWHFVDLVWIFLYPLFYLIPA